MKTESRYDPFIDWPAHQIEEWKKFFPLGGGIEIIDTQPVYARLNFTSGRTTELVFFQESFRHLSDGNMYRPSCLPSPQAFLVEKIQIEGVTSQLKHAACNLIIGSKVYTELPAWTLALKSKGYTLKHRLFIGPMVHFQFRMIWPLPVWLGRGIDGAPVLYHPLTVVLFGQRARPLC